MSAAEIAEIGRVIDLRVLNEAYDYDRPGSFSRGVRIDLSGLVLLLISGTVSIDENGNTVHHLARHRAHCFYLRDIGLHRNPAQRVAAAEPSTTVKKKTNA
jgi:hypothetical protein